MVDLPRDNSLAPLNEARDVQTLDNPAYNPDPGSARFSRDGSREEMEMGIPSTKPVDPPYKWFKKGLIALSVVAGILAVLTIVNLVIYISGRSSANGEVDRAVSDQEVILDIATLTAPWNMTEEMPTTEIPTTSLPSTTETPSTTTTSTTESTTTSTSTEPPPTTISLREQMRDAYWNFTKRFNRNFSENGLDNYVANSELFLKGNHVGETQFADLSAEQLRKLMNAERDPKREDAGKRCDIHVYHNDDKKNRNIIGSRLYGADDRIPSRIDLRRRGIIGDVRKQGTSCNVGYAFAVASLLESKVDTDGERLSVQMLLADDYNHHCEGGEIFRAMESVERDGIVTDTVLPFDETQHWHDVDENATRYRHGQACLITSSHRDGDQYYDYGTSSYRHRKLDVVAASTYITHFLAKIGTVVVEVPVDHSFFFYKSGAYTPDCENILGYQPAVVVGYGKRNGNDTWILRNSFGTEWGMEGDFEVARDANCGAFDYAFTFYNAI